MYQKTVLANGLRVVTHDMKERDSIALGFWIGVGGRYEEDRIKGAAHFLEHIVFKGSQKYGREEIKEKIEGVGGALNAFTSEEQTCFYAKIPARHIEQTFDVLADMVFYPTIAQKDAARESGVIVEEIKMYHDLPQYFVMELLDRLLWPNHPLGKNLAGTPETVSAMTARDLRNFHDQHYTPVNTAIAASGCLTHQTIVDLAERRLRDVAAGSTRSYLKADNFQENPRTHFYHKNTEQMHFVLGLLGYDERHPDRYAMGLLSTILGGNMSSRLFVEVREKRGLAYSVSSSAKSMHDTGVFFIRAGVDNKKLVEAVGLIFRELEKIKRRGVQAGEFTRAKDYLLGQLLLGLEDTMDHMLWIGEETISKDKMETLQEVIRRFEKVAPEDIKRVAGQLFDTRRFNMAVVGPLNDAQENQLSALLKS